MSLINDYELLFEKVLKNRVIDPAAYMELYAYKLLEENLNLKRGNCIKTNLKLINNQPISHASPGPDIEVFLKKAAFICELSLKSGARQFDDEHESVSRHFEEFKNNNKNKYSIIWGIFVAPTISPEISEWFYSFFGDIKVIPLSLKYFIILMDKISKKDIEEYECIIESIMELKKVSKDRNDWLNKIEKYIQIIK